MPGCCLFWADGPCYELESCDVMSQVMLSHRESPPGVIRCRIVLQLCLPSLPHPAWLAEQHRDIMVCLNMCVKHPKLLGLNVPISGYDLQKAIASEVSKPH